MNEKNVDEAKIEMGKLKAREDAVLQGQHYRISVLTERLLRLEYSPSGVFYDNKTQLISFRNFEKPQFWHSMSATDVHVK